MIGLASANQSTADVSGHTYRDKLPTKDKMMKNRLIKLVTAGLIALPALATSAAAQAVVFEQHPDPVIFNADPDNQKQRPFIVDKDEYPFKSHWFEKDGVSMHYVDEGEGFPIVLTHGNPDWSFLNRNIIK